MEQDIVTLPTGLSFISVICLRCEGIGQLPVHSGVVQPRWCCFCNEALIVEGRDWRRR